MEWIPWLLSMLCAEAALAPLLQQRTNDEAFFNFLTPLCKVGSGMFMLPLACPLAYSAELRTSTINAPWFRAVLIFWSLLLLLPNNKERSPMVINLTLGKTKYGGFYAMWLYSRFNRIPSFVGLSVISQRLPSGSINKKLFSPQGCSFGAPALEHLKVLDNVNTCW